MSAAAWASEGSASFSSWASVAYMACKITGPGVTRGRRRVDGWYIAPYIDRHIQRGGGNWPDETPATPPRTRVRRGRCQVQQAMKPGRCEWKSHSDLCSHGRGLFRWKPSWDKERANVSNGPQV